MNSEAGKSLSVTLVFTFAMLSLLIVPFHAVLVTSQVLLVLEVIGLLLLFIVFWSRLYKGKTYSVILWFLFFSIGLACLYIVPIGGYFDVNGLPGRSLYLDVDAWLAGQGIATEKSLSLIPYETTLSLLALLPPLALFFVGCSLPDKRIQHLVYLILFIASVQAVIGLGQYASKNPALYFGMNVSGSAQGSYINRDHFVALLEMTLPIAIGLMLYSFGRSSYDRRRLNNSWLFNQVLIFGAAALLIFLAAIFARSRSGVFLILLAVLISTVVFSRHVGGKLSARVSVVFSTIAVGVAVSIGLIPVLNRFISVNPVEDERFRIFEHTLIGIKNFFPFGSGPGTFPDVYRAFQPPEQLYFVNNVHNDYLELVFETGALGVFIIFGFLALYLFGWVRLSRLTSWDRTHFIRVASGIGMFLVLLHLSTEFLFHKPMNTMLFAFFAGVFFRKG